MPHILIAGKLHPAGLALLDATSGITYSHIEEISEAAYQDHLPQADAIVIRTQPLSAASSALGFVRAASSHSRRPASVRYSDGPASIAAIIRPRHRPKSASLTWPYSARTRAVLC